MNIRRVVTGHDENGKAIIVSDGQPINANDFEHSPGMHVALLWRTEPNATVGKSVTDATGSVLNWTPLPGGTQAMLTIFPPDSVMMDPHFNPMAAGRELMEKMPGLAEKFEMDAPGFHTVDTVDYGIILDGELILELDDGSMTVMHKHDVIIQNGTRHAWRNQTEKPVPVLFVLTGAKREG